MLIQSGRFRLQEKNFAQWLMPDVFPLFKEKEYGDGCKKAKYIEK
jgi:hypothetical protein